MKTEFLLEQTSTTLLFECFPQISTSLVIEVLDFDNNVVIQNYNFQSGNDHKFLEYT